MSERLMGKLRALPSLTAVSAAMYASCTIVLLIGLSSWEPGRNPRWVIAGLAAAAFLALCWTLARGQRFGMTEALLLLALQLGATGTLAWHTHDDLGAFANGTALPVIGVYAAWFLRWSVARIILYSGLLWWFLAAVHHDNQALTGFAAALVAQTILTTEVLRRLKIRMDLLVSTDPLTGVLNLRGISEALEREMARSARDHSPLSVVSIDLDGLRALNNTHGHRAGDDLLQAVTEHWRQEVRSSDLVGRTGGDEFLMLFPSTSLQEADLAVERLAARSPGSWSAGIAQVKAGDSIESVVERADQRMYKHKAARHTSVDRARESL